MIVSRTGIRKRTKFSNSYFGLTNENGEKEICQWGGLKLFFGCDQRECNLLIQKIIWSTIDGFFFRSTLGRAKEKRECRGKVCHTLYRVKYNVLYFTKLRLGENERMVKI